MTVVGIDKLGKFKASWFLKQVAGVLPPSSPLPPKGKKGKKGSLPGKVNPKHTHLVTS